MVRPRQRYNVIRDLMIMYHRMEALSPNIIWSLDFTLMTYLGHLFLFEFGSSFTIITIITITITITIILNY